MSDNPLNSIQLEQNCVNAIKTCDFGGVTGENCAAQFCAGFPATTGTCPQIGLDPQNCCESSDAASCLASWVKNGGGTETSNVCASVLSVLIQCSSADPALIPDGTIYTTGAIATSLASCACYDTDGTYDPDTFDGFASECVASGQAAHPTYYKYGTMFDGFCTDIGPAGAAATTTTSSVQSPSSVDATATAAGPVQATSTDTTPLPTESSQQTLATGLTSNHQTTTTAAGITSNTFSRSPATTATTTSTSTGFIKVTFQKGALLLLSFSVVLSAF